MAQRTNRLASPLVSKLMTIVGDVMGMQFTSMLSRDRLRMEQAFDAAIKECEARQRTPGLESNSRKTKAGTATKVTSNGRTIPKWINTKDLMAKLSGGWRIERVGGVRGGGVSIYAFNPSELAFEEDGPQRLMVQATTFSGLVASNKIIRIFGTQQWELRSVAKARDAALQERKS